MEVVTGICTKLLIATVYRVNLVCTILAYAHCLEVALQMQETRTWIQMYSTNKTARGLRK